MMIKVYGSIVISIFYFFNTLLFANSYIEEGVYKASQCNVEITIISDNNALYYQLSGSKTINKLEVDSKVIKFIGLYSTFYSTIDEKTFPPDQRAYKVRGEIETEHSFVIQNYGNATNPYIVFDECDVKYMFYKKVTESLKTIETSLKNGSKKYNIKDLKSRVPITSLTKTNLTTYNNIAYYLQKANMNKEAIYLLEKIIEKFPNRTVAYINLGDAYWGLGKKEQAKKAYETYIKQMKAKGKEKKIPKVVMQRI